jgi:hypothetical protein
VVATTEHYKLVLHQRLETQTVLLRDQLRTADDEVELAAVQVLKQLRRRAGNNPYRGFGTLIEEAADGLGNQAVGDRELRADPKFADVTALNRGADGRRLLRQLAQRAAVRRENFSFVGRCRTMLAAVEEFNANAGFEDADITA